MLLLCGVLAAMALPGSAAGAGSAREAGPADGTGSAVAPAATGTPLSDDVAYYPTTVRLRHAGEESGAVLTATVSFGPGGGSVPLYESTDDGVTFTEVGRITDDGFSDGLCCGSLLELPSPVGDLPAGTLLWTGSAGADQETDRRMRLPVFQSQDRGRTWTYLSTCATATGTGGMWEPELAVDAAGTLGCYYADENQPGHSQVLHRTTSTDGVNWGAPEPVVQVPEGDLRPGMAVVRPLPDGRHYLSYEICGGGDPYSCAAYFRLSGDGSDWGDPAAHGTLLATEDGRFFAHAPKITVTPDGKVPPSARSSSTRTGPSPRATGRRCSSPSSRVRVRPSRSPHPWRSRRRATTRARTTAPRCCRSGRRRSWRSPPTTTTKAAAERISRPAMCDRASRSCCGVGRVAEPQRFPRCGIFSRVAPPRGKKPSSRGKR